MFDSYWVDCMCLVLDSVNGMDWIGLVEAIDFVPVGIF